MKRLFVLIIFLLFGFALTNAQETIAIIDSKLEGKKEKPKAVINVFDDSTSNFLSFIKFKENALVNLFDRTHSLKSSFKIDKLPERADSYFGSCKKGKDYTLFFTNKFNSKFSSVKIDFNDKSFSINEDLGLEVKKEYWIESFESGEELFVLTVLKDSSKLKLYTFNLDGSVSDILLDFSAENIVKKNGLKTNFYHLITGKDNGSILNSAVVNYDAPITLETASAINKIYFKNGIIILTNDSNINQTYLTKINTNTGGFSFDTIDKKGFLKKELRSESNSFIYDNYFFSIYFTTSKMVLAVYNMETKEIVKDFAINKKDDIYFKNTTFIESRDGKKKFKDTYSTANFFKKVINSNSALSVRKVDGNYLISIGASEKVSNGFSLAIIGGVLGGAAGAALLSAFESYDSTKSLKIDSFFDKEFNYFKREQPANKFDLIYEYKRSNVLKNVPNQTIFEYGDFYIWGFYNRATGLYRYMKF